MGDLDLRRLERAAILDPSLAPRLARAREVRGQGPGPRLWLVLRNYGAGPSPSNRTRVPKLLKFHIARSGIVYYDRVGSLCYRATVQAQPNFAAPNAGSLAFEGEVEWCELPTILEGQKDWCSLCANQYRQRVEIGNTVPTASNGWQALWAAQVTIGEEVRIPYPLWDRAVASLPVPT